MNNIYSNLSASISEFKKSPTALLNKSAGAPIAILNHNKPTAYLIPANIYAKMLEIIEDADLLKLAQERLKEKDKAIEKNIDEL